MERGSVPRSLCRIICAMNIGRQILCNCLLGAMLFQGLPCFAATVYKTVDENGVVSYSDTPPEGDVSVETLTIDAAAPELSDTERQRLDDMRETTDRMVADRQQREKHRAELRKEQAQSPLPNSQPVYPAYPGTYPVYIPYRVVRPGHSGNRPRPVHPVARPPLRAPDPGQHTWSGSSLPDTSYPASMIRKSYSPQVRAAFEK